MRCPHCDAQWHVSSDSKSIKANCPFCNGNLFESLQEPYTVASVMEEIVSRFGVDILSNSDELISAFILLAPKLEKETQALLLFSSCGGIDTFLNLKESSRDSVVVARASQIDQMTRTITEICDAFINVIGIDLCNNTTPLGAVEWEYSDVGNGAVALTGYKGQLPTKIVFPSHIGDKRVISIGTTVLGNAKLKGSARVNVESIVIPIGISKIERNAFYGCKALKEVYLPEGLESIGENAFKSCKALINIALPESLRLIGNGVFSGSGLRSIVLPGNLGVVSREAFKNCKQLIDVTVLEGITVIQCEAFSGCKSIPNITLPDGLISIESLAFYDCKGLNSVNLPSSVNHLGCEAFKYCTALASINIPENVKDLENEVFYCCGFSSIVIPNGIMRIKEDAFANCWSLTRILIPQNVTKIDKDAFFNIKNEIRIVCYSESYAHKWARRNNVDVEIIEA